MQCRHIEMASRKGSKVRKLESYMWHIRRQREKTSAIKRESNPLEFNGMLWHDRRQEKQTIAVALVQKCTIEQINEWNVLFHSLSLFGASKAIVWLYCAINWGHTSISVAAIKPLRAIDSIAIACTDTQKWEKPTIWNVEIIQRRIAQCFFSPSLIWVWARERESRLRN